MLLFKRASNCVDKIACERCFVLVISENRKWISTGFTKGGKRGDTDFRTYDLRTCRPTDTNLFKFMYYLIQKINCDNVICNIV